MLPSPGTAKKLRRLRDELVRDFPDVPIERVDHVVHAVAWDLLGHARFDEFVPLLVDRRTRDRLAREVPAPDAA